MTQTSAPVALFPGQGSQHVGMGKDLYENFPVAREVFEECSDALHVDLKKLCFEGPETDLTLTENTQPCLLTASVAAYRVAHSELGFKPSAVAGHSLGEYSALVAAGAFPLSSAARWVRERGIAMQRAVPAGEGSMAAIMGLEEEAILRLCSKATEATKQKRASGESSSVVEAIVQPANFNAPGQIVIAGSSDAIREAVLLVQSGEFAGGKAIPLQVSAPFHCKLMAPARERMAELFLKAQPFERPRVLTAPYVPNRTARLTQESGVVFDLLVEQVDHPVLWQQSVKALLESDVSSVGVEFGPGKVLAGLVKRISRSADRKFDVVSLGDSAGLKALEAMGPALSAGKDH